MPGMRLWQNSAVMEPQSDYLTYLGGDGDNAAYGIAVDNAGNAYVAGYTDSTNFPTTNAIAIPGYNGTKISGVFDPNVKLLSV